MDGPLVREAVTVVDRSDQHLSQPFAGLLSALDSRSEVDNLGRVGSHQSRLHVQSGYGYIQTRQRYISVNIADSLRSLHGSHNVKTCPHA